MDVDGLTFVCATRVEARAARKAGFAPALVGVGARKGLPAGRLVSFGLAGALHDGLECGEIVDATRVVDEGGEVLWEGGPLGVRGARTGTIVATGRIVDGSEERRALHEVTGGDATDMESGVVACTGRLAGCIRAISDTPSRGLGPLAHAVGEDGRLNVVGVLGVLRSPGVLLDVRRGLRRLAEARL